MTDIVTVCNNALGEIAAGFITDLAEKSVEAENCKRLYPLVVRDALEWDENGFGFAKKRVALAMITNERGDEWGFAYRAPARMAKVICVIQRTDLVAPPTDGTHTSPYPVTGPYSFPAREAFGELPFVYDGDVIFTNVKDAWLEYVIDDVHPSLMTGKFRRAVELELALRLVMPVRKKIELLSPISALANMAKQWAIAENRNRQPDNDQHRITDREYALAGYVN